MDCMDDKHEDCVLQAVSYKFSAARVATLDLAEVWETIVVAETVSSTLFLLTAFFSV